MYVVQQHVATGQIANGFYMVDNDAISQEVFRVKRQPETGYQVIALARPTDKADKKARAFWEWAVITDGTLPVRPPDEANAAELHRWRETLHNEIRLSDADKEEFIGKLVERHEQRKKAFADRLTWAWDGRLYRLMRLRNNAYDQALWAATLALLDSGEQQETSGRMFALALNRCRLCNRKLTHPDSRATGIGPECAGTQRHVEVSGDAE